LPVAIREQRSKKDRISKEGRGFQKEGRGAEIFRRLQRLQFALYALLS
jgi:hypothetical protein